MKKLLITTVLCLLFIGCLSLGAIAGSSHITEKTDFSNVQTSAYPLDSGASVSGTLRSSGDQDWFRITSCTQCTVRILLKTSSDAIYLRVYNNNDIQYDSSDDCIKLGVTTVCTYNACLDSNTNYYIQISAGNNDDDVNYEFEYYCETAYKHLHNYCVITKEEASCVKEGQVVWLCACGDMIEDKDQPELIIPLTDHTYDNTCDEVCNVCNKSRTADHDFSKTVIVQATQDRSGYIATCCADCGKETKRTVIHRIYSVKLSAVSYTYSATVRTPTVTVKDTYNKVLKVGTDYTVAYPTGRKNAGTYTVKVTFKGNYTGSKALTFKINPIDISKCTVKLSNTVYTYNGSVRKPSVIVKNANGTALAKNTHYTVTYASGRKNAGTYKVTVMMKGNYSGTKVLSFKIDPINISKCSVKLSATSYTYSGSTKTPSVVVKNANGTSLAKNTHYTVTYASGRKVVGTYKVTVKMKGNYSGTKTLSFKINPISISKCSVKLSATEYSYSGGVKTPTVTVKNAFGTKLTKGTHYTVTYAAGRKNVGKYKVSVKMKGNYSGSKTVYFTIAPAVKTTVETAPKATVRLGAKSNTKITYKSLNTNIAKVSSTGVVTAVKNGTATVTVTSNGISKKVTVKVTTPRVTISGGSSVYRGKTLKLTATTNPTGQKVAWSVNDKAIAKISSSGTLTGLKRGTVTVTAKMSFKGKTYSKTYKVSVKTETPKIEVWMSKEPDLVSSVFVNITNNSRKRIKILTSRGSIGNPTSQKKFDSLYVDQTFYNSYTIKSGTYAMIGFVIEDRALFAYDHNATTLRFYFEFDGDTYYVLCRNNVEGMNQVVSCTRIE